MRISIWCSSRVAYASLAYWFTACADGTFSSASSNLAAAHKRTREQGAQRRVMRVRAAAARARRARRHHSHTHQQ